jgi:hypothetical protein
MNAESEPVRECGSPLAAHPYLDPDFDDHRPELVRSFYRFYLAIRDDDEAYNAHLNRLLHPPGTERAFESNRVTAGHYLHEATRYIEALLEILPRGQRGPRKPYAGVADTNDLRDLLHVIFEGTSPRAVFEARRKAYLAKLLLDVAYNWEVQRGEVHRAYFADLLQRELFCHTIEHREVDIAFDIAADGLAIDYRVGSPLPNEEVWRFHLHELNFLQDGRPVRVHDYFHSIRSKREVLPYDYVRGQRVYLLEAREKWEELSRRRDASIVSKMLRKGVSDPRQIPDIVGAMFIVQDLDEVELLKEALFDILGGPMKIRNVVDTLTRSSDRELLNRHSGAGYQVFKGDLELLFPAVGEMPSYGFLVELQLYTLEGYLRTIHTEHYANHQQLKRRQFLEGIVPLLWPAPIYD